MNDSVLTPPFTFVVGVVGGLILGICLCYLWFARRGLIWEEDVDEDEYEEEQDTREELSEKPKPELFSTMISLPDPMIHRLDQDRVSQESDADIVPELSLVEAAPEPEEEFRLPELRYEGNAFVINAQKESAQRRFINLEDWGKSLKRIHVAVAQSHENDAGLTGESWLNLGAESIPQPEANTPKVSVAAPIRPSEQQDPDGTRAS